MKEPVSPDPWADFDGILFFVSASFPYDRPRPNPLLKAQNDHFVETARPARIREAVVQVSSQVLARGWTIVFGGHPSITPLIASVASKLEPPKAGDPPRIVLFQSEFFSREFPVAAELLAKRPDTVRHLTPNLGELDESLLLMRRVMLGAATDRPLRFAGALFVGGMHGIFDEAELFREIWPDRPTFALGAPGGASRTLTETGLPGLPAALFRGAAAHVPRDPGRVPAWVAVEGDVVATPADSPHPAAASGAWTAGPIRVLRRAGRTPDEASTIHEARCTFAFSGVDDAGDPVTDDETVTLAAGTTTWGTERVLVEGEEARSAFGNALSVRTQRENLFGLARWASIARAIAETEPPD